MASLLLTQRKKKGVREKQPIAYLFVFPYLLMFAIFIVIPVFAAIFLSFTYFDTVRAPSLVGFSNYITILTNDDIFMQYVIPNTLKYALIVGPGGYILSFLLAWMLAQLPHKLRTVLALIIYSPSLTAGITMSVLWKVIFAGDNSGYLNSVLLNLGLIVEPIIWLQSKEFLLTIMIVVTLWSSMGVGFLAMLAGILNVNQDMYEAGYIDGIRNKFQEMIYITIPSIKPQMLFGAVMAIVGTFSASGIGVALSGSNPTPQYAGQLIVNHIEYYGFFKYEMGYAAALSVILLLIVYAFSRFAFRLFGSKNE
ncbi:MAG: sugar ABC transporter permease [Candidatus Izemoplasmatales bacterium]|jgi:multiple sugar transport system permease protein|nr:sugar ABC transporter permease [Candidatus Izemoplasmatales bacterium]MDD4354860.1 sugar ABC transporter permease [Candidatus Izemoplasmatales bacterium]MDD4988612.1 sugar ABC transporter permease [Candidatus Izemoplasmatales bacterium]NLF49131.1 sugar ABC transporter permease [Acholeplasmataceae bacterium]